MYYYETLQYGIYSWCKYFNLACKLPLISSFFPTHWSSMPIRHTKLGIVDKKSVLQIDWEDEAAEVAALDIWHCFAEGSSILGFLTFTSDIVFATNATCLGSNSSGSQSSVAGRYGTWSASSMLSVWYSGTIQDRWAYFSAMVFDDEVAETLSTTPKGPRDTAELERRDNGRADNLIPRAK